MWQRSCWALLVCALGLVIAGAINESHETAVAAPMAPAGFGSSGLITHVQQLEGRILRVIVIDPAQRVMGVYDVVRDDGEIKLRSIRNLNADLQMMQFNSDDLSPTEIQQRLNQK